MGQRATAMVAAQMFNQRADNDLETIYGAVTTGTNWKFLTLVAHRLAIDLDEYYINQVDKILAILLASLQPQAIAVS